MENDNDIIEMKNINDYIKSNTISISDGYGNTIGEFKEENGVLTFKGDVDESGKKFVDFVCKSFNKNH